MQQAPNTTAPTIEFSPHRIAYYTDYSGRRRLICLSPDGADQKLPQLTSAVSKEDKHATARELASAGKLRCPENNCKLVVAGVQDREHYFRHERDQPSDCILAHQDLSEASSWQIIARHALAAWWEASLPKLGREKFSLTLEKQQKLDSLPASLEKAPDILVRYEGKPVLAIECLNQAPEQAGYLSAKTELYRQNGVEVFWFLAPKPFIGQVEQELFELCPASPDQLADIWACDKRFYFFDSYRAQVLVPFVFSREYEGARLDATEKWPLAQSVGEEGKALSDEPARRYPWKKTRYFGLEAFDLDRVELTLGDKGADFALTTPIDLEWKEHLDGYEQARRRAVRRQTLALADQNEEGFAGIRNLVEELFAASLAERDGNITD